MIVFLDQKIHPDAGAYLREHAEVVEDLSRIGEIDGMVVRALHVPRELMEQAEKLKVVGRHGIGYEHVDIQAARERGIRVLNTPTANANSVAELIVASFLALSRNLYSGNVGLRQGRFAKSAPLELIGTEVTGKTLGLIGVGNIPQLVAGMMRAAFHVRVIGYDPFVSREEFQRRGIEKYETLEEMLENADLVNISVHRTPQTENMISGEIFDHFRPNALFVNASRGMIVNEDDLYNALTSGKLRAAASDVFAKEPCPASHKLLTLENFSATPHLGANTEEALYNVGMTIVKNVLNVLEGRPAEGIVV